MNIIAYCALAMLSCFMVLIAMFGPKYVACKWLLTCLWLVMTASDASIASTKFLNRISELLLNTVKEIQQS